MKNENIRNMIKYDYENGVGVTELSRRYDKSRHTINGWIKKEKWERKHTQKKETHTKKKETHTKKKKKHTQKEMCVQKKEIEIKQDFLNGASKQEIMDKYGIKKSAYYEKTKSVREMQIEQSEKVLQAIAEEKYSDVKDRLIEIIEEKDKLIKELLKNTNLGEKEKHSLIKDRLNLLKEIEKDLKNSARIISDYRQAELEQQLENEKILKERIELEKSKNKEIETVDLTIVEDYK